MPQTVSDMAASRHWRSVNVVKMSASTLFFIFVFIVSAAGADKYMMFVDAINLLFHEAGHVIFKAFFG